MRRPALLLFTLLASTSLYAADAPAPAAALIKVTDATFARAQPLPDWALPIGPIPPAAANAASAPVVLRLSDTQISTGGGPTAVVFSRAIQVKHRSGLGEIGQYSLGYLPAYQHLNLHKVLILRGDAVLDRTASVDARLLQRESELDNGTYGGETTVQLLLDDVRVGDTLWVTYVVTGDNPVFAGHWNARFLWDSDWPVALRRVTVLHPARRPLTWRQLGDTRALVPRPVIDKFGAIERLRFEERNLAAVQFEPRMPTGYVPVRMLQFSDFASWQDVAAWAGTLFPDTAPTPAVRALAEQFRAAGAPEAQAGAALRWVQDEIRYFSVSIGENSHRPQAPDTVLARRYGDCKDKSYLLVGILNALGIQAEPVLLSATTPRYPAQVHASHNFFDHAIVRATVNGKSFFLDPTRSSERGALATLPPPFPGAAVLVVAPATRALTVLPEAPAVLPSYERIDSFKVSDLKGAAQLESREIFRADLAPRARGRLGVMRPADVASEVLEHYERQYPGVTLAGAPTLLDDAPDGSFEVRATLTLPKAVRQVEERYVIDYDSQIADGTLGLPNKLVRQFPLRLASGRLFARYRMRLQWPDGIRARTPDGRQLLDHPYFSLRETYSGLGNTVDYLLDYRIKQDDVAAADVPALYREMRAMNGLISGSFNTDGQIGDHTAQALSLRAYSAGEQLRVVRAARAEATAAQIAGWNMPALCWHLRSAQATVHLQDAEERAQTKAQIVRFASDGRPGAAACRAQLALQGGTPEAAAAAFAAERELPADDRVRLQWAWTQLYLKQPDKALATVASYIDAARASGKLNGIDMALALGLYGRSGKPAPAALLADADLPIDAPWPAPLLAWQRGVLGEAALLAAIDAYQADARTLAHNDAWFLIGQARLANGDQAGALAALSWYRGLGIVSTVPNVLARVALRELPPGSAGAPHDAAELYRLAELNRREFPARRDNARSLRQQAEAAEIGHDRAASTLATRYLFGAQAPADAALARYWAERAIAAGQDDGYVVLARLMLRGAGEDRSAAVGMVRSLAVAGNAMAQETMGLAAMRGLGQARDPVAARSWYQRAVKSRKLDSLAALGALLAQPDHDDDCAFDVNLLASEDGNAKAQLALAVAYRAGRGTPVDAAAWVRWLRASARQDNLTAINNLGDAYETGIGVKVDMVQALALYRQAALRGSPWAFKSLWNVYQNGIGVGADRRVALTCLLLSRRLLGDSADDQEMREALPLLRARLSTEEVTRATADAAAWQLGQPLPGGAAP